MPGSAPCWRRRSARSGRRCASPASRPPRRRRPAWRRRCCSAPGRRHRSGAAITSAGWPACWNRPVSRDLFPGGEWDGEAARTVIAASPALAEALSARLSSDAPQGAAAEALRRLLDPGAGDWLYAENPAAFASATEAEEAVAALRRTLLEGELDRADGRPVPLGAGLALPQAVLRADLDRLREAGAGEAIDTLALVADGLLGAGEPLPDTQALMRRAVEAAAARGRALERAPAGLEDAA
jgi:hypothetical protein